MYFQSRVNLQGLDNKSIEHKRVGSEMTMIIIIVIIIIILMIVVMIGVNSCRGGWIGYWSGSLVGQAEKKMGDSG